MICVYFVKIKLSVVAGSRMMHQAAVKSAVYTNVMGMCCPTHCAGQPCVMCAVSGATKGIQKKRASGVKKEHLKNGKYEKGREKSKRAKVERISSKYWNNTYMRIRQ